MNLIFTIGFKFNDKDYIAWVKMLSTSAFTFYRVNLKDWELISEYGTSLNFIRDSLTGEIRSGRSVLTPELENSIIEELNRSV